MTYVFRIEVNRKPSTFVQFAFSNYYVLDMKMPHVFIDTNVFISQNYDYESTAFKQIISLAQAEKIFIYLTTITLREVEFHIERDVRKAHEAFEGFRGKADLRILKNIVVPPLYGIFNGFDIEKARDVLLNQFRQFLQEARVHVLEVTNVSVDEIFDKYFSRTPPFGEEKKKYEFPDAFALAALEQWCKESSGRMYVISSDTDLSAACALNQSLRLVQSLSEFLDLLTRRGEQAEFINRLFEAHKEEIEERVKSAVNPLNLIYEPYGEVQYTYINSAKILKHYLIEVDEGKAIFDVTAEVKYSANVLYHNSAARMMMGGMGAREELDYGSTNVKAEVSLLLNKDNRDEFKIEGTVVKNQNIYIFPDEGPDDFASKYTKAQKSLPAHAALIIDLFGGNEWVIANSPETIVKRFERIKESIPVRVMLDLQTLSMLDTSNASLSYQGAMTIKHQAEKRSPHYRLMRQASETAQSLDSLHARRAFEAARSLEHPLMRHAAGAAALSDSPGVRQIIEANKWLDNSHIRQAAEAAGLWWKHPLSGHSMSQDIHADISPKRLSDLQNGEDSRDVRVEVLLNSELYDSPDNETDSDIDESDERAETPPYEFNNSPLTITLTHSPDTPHSYKTSHRLRKPTVDEWKEWSLNIKRTRRYSSPAEIAEYNARKGEDEEAATEIWSPFYSEWEANKQFYNKLILEIAGAKLDKDDDFPTDQFRELDPEIIENLRLEIKNSVITKLYRCYCDVEKPATSDNDGQRIYQNINFKSSSFDVIHILRKPSEDENYTFRTNIVSGSFSTDEEGKEIIQLKLNLSTAVEFYDNLLINIENATVGGQMFSDETRGAFLEAINPVYKLRILEPLFDVNAWYFKIDDWTFP